MYFAVSPLGKRHHFSVEQTWILFTKGWFVPSSVKNGSVIQETIFLIWSTVNVFSLFRYHLLLKKGMPLYVNNLNIPFTQGCCLPSLVEIFPVVLHFKLFSPWTYNSFTPWCHVLTTPPFPWWRLWRLVYSAVIWACLFCLHTTITAQVANCMLIIHDYNNDFTWFQFFCTMIKIIYRSKIWPFSISHAFAFIYSLQVFQI